MNTNHHSNTLSALSVLQRKQSGSLNYSERPRLPQAHLYANANVLKHSHQEAINHHPNNATTQCQFPYS